MRELRQTRQLRQFFSVCPSADSSRLLHRTKTGTPHAGRTAPAWDKIYPIMGLSLVTRPSMSIQPVYVTFHDDAEARAWLGFLQRHGYAELRDLVLERV